MKPKNKKPISMQDYSTFKYSPSVWLVPFLLLFTIWAVFIIDNLFGLDLNLYGIFPRTISGLKGILFSPFLHGDLNHIANNSLPLFILTSALIYFYRDISLKILFFGIIFSGLLTWIIARNSYHIGASSLIYVLVSFIFFKGLITRYFRLMALSFAVVLFYGGMIWYVFPGIDNTISWEGHLSGLIVGFVFARYFKTPNYKKQLVYDWEKPSFIPEEDNFMKHFDENGNFVNTPKPEEELDDNLQNQINVFYEYKELPKENK